MKEKASQLCLTVHGLNILGSASEGQRKKDATLALHCNTVK